MINPFAGNLNIQLQSTPEVTTQPPVIDIVSNLTELNMETESFTGSAVLNADSQVRDNVSIREKALM